MYFIKIALRRLTMRPWSSMFLIIGMAFVLAVGSSLYSLAVYMKNYSGEESHPVYAFIKPEIESDTEITSLHEKLKTNPEITKIEYVDRNGFVENYSKKQTNVNVTLTAEDKDIIPRYFLIHSKNPGYIKTFLSQETQIEYADYNEVSLNKLKKTFLISSNITMAIGIGLALILIIALINQLKVTLYVNKDEVDVLTLLGASKKFIMLPIIVESAFYGFFGGILGFLLRTIWEYKSQSAIIAFFKTIGLSEINPNRHSILFFLVSSILISLTSALMIRPKQKGIEK